MPETVAEGWLALLKARGVDCLFANPGTEFTAIIEGLAKLGDRAPRPVMVPHEFTAVAMAHGYYAMTDRPQAVMVHVTVGAANALGALMDAAHLHVPVLFFAGRTPITEEGRPGHRDKFIHWAQESFDQGGMLRETVKWDYELRDPSTLEATVDRALAIASSEPAGPVYLTLPRERLMEPLPAFSWHPDSLQPPARPPGPEPAAVEQAAEWVAASRHPLVVANRLAADAVGPLAALADDFGIPVSTPNAHVFCAPRPVADDAVRDADCLIVLDVDVPWCPLDRGPSPAARVVSVGADPLHGRIAMRSHRADLVITATPRLMVEALHAALKRMGMERREPWASPPDLRPRIARARSTTPIDPLWVAACLGEQWDDDIVLVNELSLPPDPLPLHAPRTYLRASPASCLGWGLGAALGAGLADRSRTPIAVVGDGAYLFANPPVAHWVSRAHDIPFLTVVLDNGGMRSIAGATRRAYPGGCSSGAESFTSLEPSLDLCRLVEAADGWGLRVDDPEALPDAIRRALTVVRTERRQALLDVRTQ
jgi:acetolactate synthase-1/2/3 large subunit